MRMNARLGFGAAAAAVTMLVALGATPVRSVEPKSPPALAAAAVTAKAPDDAKPDAEWGSIVGRVLWGKDELPTGKIEIPANNADIKHCSKDGAPPDETFIVDPATKGVANVFVYLRKAPKIHPGYPATKEDVAKADEAAFAKANGGITYGEAIAALASNKVTVEKLTGPAVMDQVNCRYTPHALGLREGQKLLVKNPEPVNHNVNVISFADDNKGNNNMPPKTIQILNLVADAQPVGFECNVHGWMKAYILVVDHPYFAVTGKDGSFALKNVPTGELDIAIRNSNGIYVQRLLKVTVEPGKVTTLADFKFAPKL